MNNLILRLKLMYWWHIDIKRDEFSPKLNIAYIHSKFRKLPFNDRNIVLYWRRDIAHKLDSGTPISNINIKSINSAKL
jgi:hypothetical protein